MKIKFHGPIGRVTGSAYELHHGDYRFLVDCGQRQGPGSSSSNRGGFPFDPRSIHAVVLTHAHLDHCGMIPRLYQRGFRGPVYCTHETRDLAREVLRDSAKLDSLHTLDDVNRIKWSVPADLRSKEVRLEDDLTMRFFETGHILGACAVRFTFQAGDGKRSITFSGDVGPGRAGGSHLPLLPSRTRFDHGDYTVVESTYGATVRSAFEADLEHRLDRLELEVRRCRHQRGVLIIPCFAIGRTQDVLFDLHLLTARDRLPVDLPIILDAGLATRINGIYAAELRRRARRESWSNHALFDALRIVVDGAEARAEIDEALARTLSTESNQWGALTKEDRDRLVGPAVVVTGGGMCDGGFVQRHLARHLTDPSCTVLLTGYATPSSVAGQLQRMNEDEDIAICVADRFLKPSEVKARVTNLRGYSAHADQAGLLDWVFGADSTSHAFAPRRRLFVTHGEPRASRALVKAADATARRRGLVTTAHDRIGERWFDLARDTWCEAPTAGGAAIVARR